ncbi:MAG: ShlB/FhaC/HecB family hemolysin secretion/activation protein [candidate division Zixibacteria bacterium]|nr:ShlB/FhaC/HecB family hemolysin secretion/activation protein [candidate division Zixibacteria bacterium]
MEKEDKAPPLPDSGEIVLVKKIVFTGYEGITTEVELQELVHTSIGKKLGITELRQITSTVTRYLREIKGYPLAQAYLPEQDITEGSITIAILPGRIDGKVEIRIKEPGRINPSLLEGIANRAIPEDRPLRMERIERAVLLMNDLPGISARASLEPGSETGSTRVIVNTTEGPLFEGILSGDTYGDRYTGVYRATGQIFALDAFGLGDQIGLSFTGAKDLTLSHISYGVPLGSSGLAWDIAYDDLRYKLGKELEVLDAEGKARNLTTTLQYPVIRTRKASLGTGIGLEHLMLEDEANDIKTCNRELLVGSAFVSGTFYDTFFGGGLTNASLTLTGGDADLSGCASNEAIDNAGAGTSGNFFRGNYSLARLQRVTGAVSLFGFVRGQVASGNLDSSQKFILGGPSGVRAYPVSEAPGDEGHLFSLETRVDLPFTLSWATAQLVGFFDTGYIRQHKEPWSGSITTATGKNDYWLHGPGVGITMGKAGVYRFGISYAHTIGANDGESANGKDADNLDDNGRFWCNLTIWL